MQVNLHVSLATLLGVDEAPGWVDGQGPVTAAEARRVAHQLGGTWARIVDDPLGQPLAHGRRAYQPPQALADHVLARDGECSFPSCRQPGWSGDLDHITAWNDGGLTDPANLAVLCRRHHRGKTLRALSYLRRRDGSHAWSLAKITGGNQRAHHSEPPRRLDPAPWVIPDECPF